MESSIGFFLNESDDDSGDEVTTPAYIKRKRLRDNSNVLDMPNKSFIKLFRVSKQLFVDILSEIEPHFSEAKKIDAIPPILKVAATLRFMAEGSYQRGLGQDFLITMSQSTVSIVMTDTLQIMESHLCSKYINFKNSDEEKLKSKEYFFNKYGFPGVVGCVDGTHVNIIRPEKNEHHFFNRKGAHSLNVMITCDFKNEITSVDPRFGGCSHDSVIWGMSDNRLILEQNWKQGDKSSWILGDSGYTLEPWMMTPYRKTIEGSPEARFNNVHAKARSIVERVFGILKGRWRCLLHTRELHYKPEKVARITNVCCALHNLCTRYHIPIDEDDIVMDLNTNSRNTTESDEGNENILQEARRVRDSIRDNL